MIYKPLDIDETCLNPTSQINIACDCDMSGISSKIESHKLLVIKFFLHMVPAPHKTCMQSTQVHSVEWVTLTLT